MATTHYVWDYANDSYLMEKDIHGETLLSYTSEPTEYGRVVSQHGSEVSRYYHFDALGSTTELTDATQVTTDGRRYSAFGEVVTQSGMTQLHLQFVGSRGYYNDDTLGVQYVRRRSLSPSDGTWNSVDPVRDNYDQTFYTYANNKPTVAIDPSGEITVNAYPPADPKCNKANPIVFEFILDYQSDPMDDSTRGAPCNGFIVQEVSVTCKVKLCDKCFGCDLEALEERK
jgi:RHS repeat-associated protein